MVIAYYIMHFMIPFTILLITTYQLIRSLNLANQKKAEITSAGSKPRDEITLSLVTVVIIFVACQITYPVSTTFIIFN